MHLLNTTTLTLHEFHGDAIPNYAILSHRWEGEEVTFQDLQAGRAHKMKEFLKIKGFCAQALLDGWLYAWVDCCCIDKTSSAELTESINSMFQWYQKSQACYVYLSDVSAKLDWDEQQGMALEFRRSRWFTRGWTLQELIAPSNVIFYTSAWEEIGSKHSLEKLISAITKIAPQHLRDHTKASVSQKLSWAAKRETTRVEDRAYSLMGLFEVHMPPLYGEGVKAFRRLQLEILASSDDESIFAWATTPGVPIGLLAESPSEFSGSGDIFVSNIDKNRPPFWMTNKGLRMELFLVPRSLHGWFSAPLNCARRDGENIALYLFKQKVQDKDAAEDEFRRDTSLGSIIVLPRDLKRATLFVKDRGEPVDPTGGDSHDPPHSLFRLQTASLLKNGFSSFQEAYLGRHERIHIRALEAYGLKSTTSGLVVRNNSVKLLQFTNNTLSSSLDSVVVDSFVVILGMTSDPIQAVHLNIVIEQDIQELRWSNPDFSSSSDRISKTMKSGKSVSVALRTQADLGKPSHVIDITIDPKGKLPWPDFSLF